MRTFTTRETCYNDLDQGHVAGYSADGTNLWTVNSADSMDPDDDSGQWLWTDEVWCSTKWFDSMEEAVYYAERCTYGGV